MKQQEKTGSVPWMEYVIAAVVILAAVLLCFAIWGESIFGSANCAAEATCGARSAACEDRSEIDAACQHQSRFENEDAKSSAERGPRHSTVNPVPFPDDGGPTPSEEFK